ncbi:TPA: hypothetical protein HA278_07615 [Candidatus Woesearchaeota archaeon]|jgi:hypothetical protein|nr:hypothetical protein [Candidatus Woesearchaeota archaeon]
MAKRRKPASNSNLPSLSDIKRNAFKAIREATGAARFEKLSELNRIDEAIGSMYHNLRKLNDEEVFASSEKLPVSIHKRVGEMWMFSYNQPSTKVKYWDAFPCVIIVEIYRDGFLGINLHYLPEKLREALWVQLWNLRNEEDATEDTRLKIGYQLIQEALRFRYAKPCIKRYKYKNMEDSKLIKIPPRDWHAAMYMPMWNFKGKNARNVWMESRQQIARENRSSKK